MCNPMQSEKRESMRKIPRRAVSLTTQASGDCFPFFSSPIVAFALRKSVRYSFASALALVEYAPCFQLARAADPPCIRHRVYPPSAPRPQNPPPAAASSVAARSSSAAWAAHCRSPPAPCADVHPASWPRRQSCQSQTRTLDGSLRTTPPWLFSPTSFLRSGFARIRVPVRRWVGQNKCRTGPVQNTEINHRQ